MKMILPLAMSGLLAACGQPASETANTATTANAAAATPSGYIAKVKALPPGQRDGVLFRAIQQGGGDSCQGVQKVEALDATKQGHPNWRVTCPGGAQWIVTLSDDGTALVTGARDPVQPVR